MNNTVDGDRLQIAFFGRRNAGKSSIVNNLTGQRISIVSDIKGTTTDPVKKAMEILPLGPCLIVDTPGLDDKGELGSQRVEKSLAVLRTTDVAVLVVDMTIVEKQLRPVYNIGIVEEAVLNQMNSEKIPTIIVLNKADRVEDRRRDIICEKIEEAYPNNSIVMVDAKNNKGIDELKKVIIDTLPDDDGKLHILDDFIDPGDLVVLVTPIDESAPKGRIILPQQQVIRDILDNHAMSIVTGVEELEKVMADFKDKVKLVITDSQAFDRVNKIVDEDILLTSFSILFAKHKGNLLALSSEVNVLNELKDGDVCLIAEGCTHHRQCNDIGSVKIPNWLKDYTKKDIKCEFANGKHFPQKLDKYSLIIQCGGCMLSKKEMQLRIDAAKNCGVPIINYGIFIAAVNGIFPRSIALFPELKDLWG